MKQKEWNENIAGQEWNMNETEWNRQNEEWSWNEAEWNKKEAEWNSNEAEWSSFSERMRQKMKMKQKWSKIRNETKSVSFISGSWTRQPTVATVNASCKW